MLKKILSSSSAVGIALVMTSSWVGQAQAFTYTTIGGVTGQAGFTCAALAASASIAQTTNATATTYGAGGMYDPFTGCNASDTRFKPSTSVTGQATLRTAVGQMTGLISNRVASLRNPGMRKMASNEAILGEGLSAGDQHHGVGAWVNTAWSRPKNTLSSTQFDGDIFNGVLGVDYDLAHDMRAGLAFAYEREGISTAANKGHVTGKGVGLIPYLSYDFDDMITFDAQVGYEHVDYSLRRRDPALTEYVAMITGNTVGHRWFGVLNANTGYEHGNFDIRGKVGVTYAHESRDGYNDSSAYHWGVKKNHLGRADIGFIAGYDINMMVEPFVGADALWDFNQTNVTTYTTANSIAAAGQVAPDNSRFAVIYSAGIKFDLAKGMDASLSANYEAHRKHYHSSGAMLSINSGF